MDEGGIQKTIVKKIHLGYHKDEQDMTKPNHNTGRTKSKSHVFVTLSRDK